MIRYACPVSDHRSGPWTKVGRPPVPPLGDQADGCLVVVAESLRDDRGWGLKDELTDRGATTGDCAVLAGTARCAPTAVQPAPAPPVRRPRSVRGHGAENVRQLRTGRRSAESAATSAGSGGRPDVSSTGTSRLAGAGSMPQLADGRIGLLASSRSPSISRVRGRWRELGVALEAHDQVALVRACPRQTLSRWGRARRTGDPSLCTTAGRGLLFSLQM